MNIVVLDGYTTNPGDLSWEGLAALGDCTVYDRSGDEEVLPRAEGAEIVLVNKVLMTGERIAHLERLRYIGLLSTGYNVVDLPSAREQGIVVSNVPSYSTMSVAQLVFAHLLRRCHHVAEHAQGVREGRWSASEDFCYWDYPLVELAGQTMGIVGYGRIGQATTALARAFGMSVLVYDVRPPDDLPEGVTFTDRLDDVFGQADVVSLHCPLTDDNQGMVDRRRLELMKRTAVLINLARGPLVDEDALADALEQGQIAGAALDVLSAEPPPEGSRLLTARNCQITPHIAWATQSARKRLIDVATDNVRAFLEGRPQNAVSG